MLRIGLTGGTGAGKSTVAARLAALGAVVVDADALAREVVAPGTEGLAAVTAEFGLGVLAGDGSLDRAALAAVVFADPARRTALEAITHPRIAARTAQLLAAAPPEAIVVHDVPLLVEKRMGAGYHLVVVVDAPQEVRVSRLVSVRGMAEEDARARVRAQATEAERRAAADVWLDNSADEAALLATVDRLWRDRLVPFERNQRGRRAVPWPEAGDVSGPDPTWAAQAARLAARVQAAAGDVALGTEHVGPTAVPGLPARDLVELQLGVRSLDHADVLADRLADAGFPPLRGHAAPSVPGVGEPERRHGSADPARPVDLRVREVGGPAWRCALLLRDFLRADPAARSSTDVLERAREWARRTGWTPPLR